MSPMNTSTDNRTKVMQVAMQLAQTRGFNAFSYRDLAHEVGIKTSSIHYHFPTKDDLGVALMQEYTAAMMTTMAEIQASQASHIEQFRAFVGVFDRTAATGDQLCLAGMFGSAVETLTPELKAEVLRFFSVVEDWLTVFLQAGRDAQAFAFANEPNELAAMILAALEGSLMTARLFGGSQRLQQSAAMLEVLLVAQ
jgi:TetR/AcrR family transcriptional repressor of nem operon